MNPSYDALIVGGGIVGVATAREIVHRRPGSRVIVVEKEQTLAAHQSGRNSGVIHSGVYYAPGSTKARLCVEGGRLLREFCARRGVPVQVCGKVIVATYEAEIPRLDELLRRGQANGVEGVSLIGPGRLREIEPHAAGVRALHVPGAAITDFARVAAALTEEVRSRGGDVKTGARVIAVRREPGNLVVETTTGPLHTRSLINCAGLHSDRVARRSGARPSVRIIPFRGEFYRLRRPDLVRGLIYPAPDPALPFLGVHFTRLVAGGVEAGPNAVLALKREGYRRSDLDLLDIAETLGFSGFWRMARRHWRSGLAEMARSLSRADFARSLQRLVPEVTAEDLVEGRAGVRAQAVDPEGRLVDDFRILAAERALHVLNAPSPAATAALAIGRHVVDEAEKHLFG